MTHLLNLLLYQIGWFACVLGAAYSLPWSGTTLGLSLAAVHFTLTTDRIGQARLTSAATVIGLIVDTTLLRLGVYEFESGTVVAWLPPPWMSVLWVLFASTTRYSMRWLSKRYLVCSVFGLVGAPLAFLGGEALGAISFCDPRTPHLVLLALAWAVAVPALIQVSDRLYAAADSNPCYRIRGMEFPH